METESSTSTSLENRIKTNQNKYKFYFTEEDDEILNSNAMQLPDNPEIWLYVSEQSSAGEQSRLENHTLESVYAADNVSSVLSQSRRNYDSRTYTRPKKRVGAGACQLPSSPFASAEGTFRMDCTKSSYAHPFAGPHLSHFNYSDDNTMESSLGIIDLNNLTESQLGFKMALTEFQSSTPPPEALNVTYEKNNSTLCIASDGPLNSTFTLQETPDHLPPARQNSKFAKNLLPEPYPIGLNSKFSKTPNPEPSAMIYNSKLAKTPLTESSLISRNSKFVENQSPEPSPILLNSKFIKKPLSESTPLVKNSRFVHSDSTQPTNSHFNSEVHDEEEMNGDIFSNTYNKGSGDYLMNVSFPIMMQSSSSIQSDPSLDNNTFEVNPNTTIEKTRNFESKANTTFDKRTSLSRGRSSTPENDDLHLDNIEVNPNTTIDKIRSRLGQGRASTIENVVGDVAIDNFEVNPNSTIDKRRISFGHRRSSSTDVVNNVNAKYQESLKNAERIRERLVGTEDQKNKSKNMSQITPPQSEFLGEPVSFSTPCRETHQKPTNFTNGCSSDSPTECNAPSPVSLEDPVSSPKRASSVPPPANLDGTFCKSDFSKKGAKLMEGGGSPLNSTFRKTPLSSTFCKSAEALNNGGVGGGGGGSAESGPEEDGMSTASDSSFSSSSTHMRSVGEIQSIARLQEESLSLQNNTALRKIAWGGSDSGDGELIRGNQTVFRKQPMSDEGNQSDHSERCSPSSERCSPTALNNNLRNVSRLSLKPLSSYGRTGGLSLQHARSVEQLPSGMSLARSKPTFGLKRPTSVNRPASQNPAPSAQQQQPTATGPPTMRSRLQASSTSAAPAAAAAVNKCSGIRPPTAIPRPVSRLPAPKIKTGLPRYNSKTSGQS